MQYKTFQIINFGTDIELIDIISYYPDNKTYVYLPHALIVLAVFDCYFGNTCIFSLFFNLVLTVHHSWFSSV